MLDIDATAVLRRTYPDGIVEIDYKKANARTMALIKKTKGALVKTPFGEAFQQPVKHGNPQAGSADYAVGFAQAPDEASRYQAWLVTPAEDWHFADIAGRMVRRSEGVGGFIDALISEIENAKDAKLRNMQLQLFRSGYGDLGQISALPGAGVITLADPTQVRYFEAGQILTAASALVGVAVRVGLAKVLRRNAGTITVGDPITLVPGVPAAWMEDDFLFRNGDRETGIADVRRCITGFPTWLPPVAPTTPLFSVDRTIDDRLGGLRQDATLSASMEESLLDGCSLIDSEGGVPTHITMGPTTFNQLVKSMQNRVHYVESQTDVGIGIPGFRINGFGDPMVYSDSCVPEGLSYIYNVDEIELRYAGKDLMYIEDKDGLMFRRVPGTDAWRTEIVSSPQLIIPAPGHACVVFNQGII